MSGRDLRSFLEGHRAETFSLFHGKDKDLHGKYLAGGVALGGRGLKAVDYGELLTKAQEHRHAAQLQAQKLQALSKQGQSSREAWFLRLHQGVWQHEWSRLVTEGLRLERQLDQWRMDTLQHGLKGAGLEALQQQGVREGLGTLQQDEREGLDTLQQDEREWMAEIMTYSVQLHQEMEIFKRDKISVLHHLQVDLENWVNRPEAERGVDPQCAALQDRCGVVKMQLDQVGADLQDEYLLLWSDLNEFSLVDRDKVTTVPPVLQEECPNHAPHNLKEDSVPHVLQEKCPDPILKTSLMAEFHDLKKHYQLALQSISGKYFKTGLSEEVERAGYAIEQYPLSLQRRRAAYLDRLAREFPHHTRKQLVAMETAWLSWQHGLQLKEACLRDWTTQYKALEVRVRGVLEEYGREMAIKVAGQEIKDVHSALCKRLRDKVSKWREEKEILQAKQTERENALLLECKAAQEREERKRRQKRERTKVKVEVYHAEEKRKRAEEEAWLARLREEGEEMKREEAVQGRVRVSYRREQRAKKLSEQQKLAEEKEEEVRERERRLDALREQVKVCATSDPDRVLQPTVAVRARLTSDLNPDLQQPLFHLHGFSAEQVTSDPRVRLEQALRHAGLHRSEYARHVLASVQPPTAPRPDQHSSLFSS